MFQHEVKSPKGCLSRRLRTGLFTSSTARSLGISGLNQCMKYESATYMCLVESDRRTRKAAASMPPNPGSRRTNLACTARHIGGVQGACRVELGCWTRLRNRKGVRPLAFALLGNFGTAGSTAFRISYSLVFSFQTRYRAPTSSARQIEPRRQDKSRKS